ncbi:DNA-binding response OmpR family regulator [Kribbella amoyensis]|uniref:DNA-binding response OmpR family regulator n=1 Tax=Kribbella amoyensis TaxID=996641 RepID=A0A561C157_9ACTN|nr:response regulator transcription factor [Kribbella amoyensis]TWD84911.1 DNA-binding response OmpR family regulator [Kribbella amoyensis]
MATRVLVVDDDPTVSNVVSAYLTKAGYDARMVADGGAAVEVWQQWRPSVVVLDVMLPGVSGLEVLRRMRSADDGAAVIMLSARGEEEDRLVGLEFGADDYVVKPFSPRELTLRVQAMVRREERLAGLDLTPTKLTAGPVVLDTGARTASLDGTELSLTHREFDLLAFLIAHQGKAYTKAELLRRVWGWDFGDSSTVTVHVRRLREKLEADPSDPKLVLTIPRTGYLFAAEAE